MDDTFNCLSIDTDTSTSDTAVVLANGAAGPVNEAALGRRPARGLPGPDPAVGP